MDIPLSEFTPDAAWAEMPDAETSFSTLPDYVAGENLPYAETSFITQDVDAYGNPLDTLYNKSTRDGNAFDTPVDAYGTPLDTLPDPPLITPSTEPGGNIGNLRDEIAAAELTAAKTNLVNKYYQSIAKDYKGLPLPEKIPYDQFGVSGDGKTLNLTPEEGKVIPLRNSRGGSFLALGTLAQKSGNGGTDAIRTSMGLETYTSKTRKKGNLSPRCKKAVQRAYDIILAKDENITPVVGDHVIASLEIATNTLDEELTPEESAALGTINDPPLDLQWVSTASRELRGLDSAMTRMRDELVNNEAKLSELEEHLALERRKLDEAPDEATGNLIAERIKGLEDDRATRREIASGNREALRSHRSRLHETLHRILHEDKTLAERIRSLFREQGITIASILTALGMTISTLVLALTGGSGGGAAPPPPPTAAAAAACRQGRGQGVDQEASPQPRKNPG